MTRYFSYFLIFLCYSVGAIETYNIDPEHSFSNWKIRHVVSMTSGTVSDMSGIITIDRDDINKSEINIIKKILKLYIHLLQTIYLRHSYFWIKTEINI